MKTTMDIRLHRYFPSLTTLGLSSVMALTALGCGEDWHLDVQNIAPTLEVWTTQYALTAECMSIVPHVSEARCQALACAPVYQAFCSIIGASEQAQENDGYNAHLDPNEQDVTLDSTSVPDGELPETTHDVPSPPSENAIADGCTLLWDAHITYARGDAVEFGGLILTAGWETRGDQPDDTQRSGVCKTQRAVPTACPDEAGEHLHSEATSELTNDDPLDDEESSFVPEITIELEEEDGQGKVNTHDDEDTDA